MSDNFRNFRSTPQPQNVRYFAHPQEAEAAGFRACLRCRPEAAPGSPVQSGSESTVRRGLRLIDAGAWDELGSSGFADRLGTTLPMDLTFRNEQGEVVKLADYFNRGRPVVLMLVYTSSHVDRQIMGILLEPIKQDLGASDTQMGFLIGLTFALFYATLGMPIAMLADRSNRRKQRYISRGSRRQAISAGWCPAGILRNNLGFRDRDR